MHAWEAIQSVINHIEENLAQKIQLKDLAQISNLSPFYFQRLFTRLVGRPVNDYVKMRRLAKSCDMLRDKNKRILDVALDSGFGNHESFTKAFKNAFDITPEKYRKNPIPLNCVIKPELLLNYTIIDESIPLIADGIVIEIMRKKLKTPENYLGVSSRVPISKQLPIGEATGIDVPGQLWGFFHKTKETISGLVPGGIELGASIMEEEANETFTYFVGASAQAETSCNNEFVKWELPVAEYVVCRVEAETFTELTTSALDKAMKYLFGTWLPSHQLVTAPFSAEKYYQPANDLQYMEIWVIPIPIDHANL